MIFCVLVLCSDPTQCFFLLRVDSRGPVCKQILPVWLGAQPKCCAKAKEFEQHGKNVKSNNRISGAVWTVGTGNAPVLREEFGICYPLLSSDFPRKEMEP